MSVEKITSLFKAELSVVNLGLEGFAEDLSGLGVPAIQVDWRPPAGGDARLAALFDRIEANTGLDVAAANQEAVGRILKSKPTIVGIGVAEKDIPGMHKKLILHAGPPVTWERMCGSMRGAVIGGLIYEGLAGDEKEAEKLAGSGEITFEPCHHHSTVGPMAGIVTASMPVWILENSTYDNRAYATLNEGLGKVLRYGANSSEVIEKLKWMETDLAPILSKAIDLHGPIDMKNLIAQVLQMGDEGHNRNRAGTSLFIRELAPHLVMLDEPK
ncbi:MAG: DUF1116 domain-containing protein, partial [Spirochaetaceae bacterium]|nr:DUF1116 domain-containing protein [Spirochaetaceae bacterium]